ncbi:COG1361 S-layer family protein [Halomicrobium urmianum]|uniref:COG1361 S-layer family protein n=1 Tax=Halomicrobium urmianum TaxID=1586233 RepID=UPI001CD9387C|nr:hypothetical protein [Halomicrobium urmianum]
MGDARPRFALALGAVALLCLSGAGTAAVLGSPDLDVRFVDGTVRPGETATLEVVVVNSGTVDSGSLANPALADRVTTARGLVVRLGDRAPISVRSDAATVGTLGVGRTEPLPFTATVAEDADPGTVDVPVTLSYEYTSYVSEGDGTQQEESVRTTTRVPLTVAAAPRFEVRNVTTTVGAGERGAVAVTLENVGSAPASDAALTLSSDSGDLAVAESGAATRYVDDWRPDETRTLRFPIAASEGAEPGTIAATLSTRYDDDGVRRNASPLSVPVAVGPRQQFSVVATETDVTVGSRGTYAVTVRNDGPAAVGDAHVALSSPDGAVTVGGGESSSRYVGQWPAGAERTIRFDVAAVDAAAQKYAMSAAVEYEDAAGDARTATGLSAPFRPAAAPAFAVESTGERLRVGAEGTVAGTVANRGQTAARDAVLVVESAPEGVTPAASRVPLGDLGPNESTEFRLPATVASSVRAGTRTASVRVEYDAGGDGERAVSDARTVVVNVTDEPFVRLSSPGAALEPDSDGRVRIAVENVWDRPLRDVEATVAARPPFESASPSAFADALAPDETANLSVQLSVSEDAVPSRQSLPVNVTAETTDGRTLTDRERVAVAVVESDAGPTGGDTAVLAVGAVIVAVALAIGWRWLNQ